MVQMVGNDEILLSVQAFSENGGFWEMKKWKA